MFRSHVLDVQLATQETRHVAPSALVHQVLGQLQMPRVVPGVNLDLHAPQADVGAERAGKPPSPAFLVAGVTPHQVLGAKTHVAACARDGLVDIMVRVFVLEVLVEITPPNWAGAKEAYNLFRWVRCCMGPGFVYKLHMLKVISGHGYAV